MPNRKDKRRQASQMKPVKGSERVKLFSDLAHLKSRMVNLQKALLSMISEFQKFYTIVTILKEKGIITDDEIANKEDAITKRFTGDGEGDSVQSEEREAVEGSSTGAESGLPSADSEASTV